jgi:antitoxin (DNA-binding transcriptional repressor) of toxin-antitoxin stability system
MPETIQEGERPMSSTIAVKEAQARLKELIDQLGPGEELVITDHQQPVAKLVGQGAPARKPRQPGGCKGMITLLVEDDEHLKDFAEYMP